MSNDIFTVALEYKEIGREKLQKNYDNFIQSVNRGSQAEQNASKASQQNSQSKQRLTRATRDAANAQQRVRQQFLATANSIAVLDGPLGGIASRFSSFGVLIGRIGIPLAGLAVGLSTFTFAAQRAIRELTQWEVQIATLENRLNSVGNQINLTSQEIIRMSEQIGLSTLADEREVLRAAGSLLTFRRIGTDVFEDVLRSAQDLAASGFGTLESETLRLAKALEDPRQSLTALSRAGITFTRQQRQVIISMVDSGREAEAMQRILQNVERQVGGAGLAQANNTLAGSFDTIGQGIRTVTRDFADFVTEGLLVRNAIDGVADRFNDFLQRRSQGPDEALRRVIGFSKLDIVELDQEIQNLDEIVKRFNLEVERPSRGGFGFLNRGNWLPQFVSDIEEALRLLIEVEEVETRLNAARSQVDRRSEALTELEAQIDLQTTLIGLTQEQERVQRALNAEGFGGDVWANINREVQAYADSLTRSGVEAGMVHRMTQDLRKELEGARDVAERYAEVFESQRIAREINRIEESTLQTNDALRRQVEILEEARAAGDLALTVTEARRQADLEIQIQMIETRLATLRAADAAGELAVGFANAAEQAAEVARLAAIIAELNETVTLQAQVASLGRPERGGGGGGGGRGTDPNAEYQRELEALQNYLERRREEMMIARGFEREIVMEQYEERFQALQAALDRQLVTRQEYDDLLIQLTQSREDRITEIERTAASNRLTAWSGAFGDLASLMSTENKKLFRIGQAAAIAQATVDGYAAAVSAWEKGMKIGGPPVAAAFTAMSLARTGALIAGIGGRQPGGRGGRGGRGSRREAAAPREAREATPQRVLIQGLDPTALYTGEQLQNLFEAFQNENNNRGQVFVVSR